ncbi:type II toxin-antitoxin system RelE/ParE family toxin [Thauera sp.]|uniref:type II toxin-antitoxin system RelE/ParE family toxin n=1 Tax=Thauera sp. TaxID=1905334 RepID=UPI00257ADFBA|nr:type II toxin-antitoxin system RelE/ParE family toxin [Thauera sp.]
MSVRAAVRVTRNFERNLDGIETFLTKAEAPGAFVALLDELADMLVPTLERHPDIGRDFLSRIADSAEAELCSERVQRALHGLDASASLREYVMAHYLVLYAHATGTVYLLSIRHQRQSVFDVTLR